MWHYRLGQEEYELEKLRRESEELGEKEKIIQAKRQLAFAAAEENTQLQAEITLAASRDVS